MLPDKLLIGNFCTQGCGSRQVGSVMTLVEWVDYHFGGRPEIEVCSLLEAAVQCTGLPMGEDQGYTDFFGGLSASDAFHCWQEVLAHA